MILRNPSVKVIPYDQYKIFQDSIHGSISIHPLCVKIIDTPQFQRLRFLKQLGPACYVYPSAGHSRFEHCIGVSHLAGSYVRALQKQINDTLECAENTFLKNTCVIDNFDILCVEIAGLCHDLGHGPFSHLWETFLEHSTESNWKHENTSIELFDHLLEQNNLAQLFKEEYGLTDTDITFIKEMIIGIKPCNRNPWKQIGRCKDKSFLYDIVNNTRNGVDVDKWDYILRDSTALGIKVTFDPVRLMKFSRVAFVPNEGFLICVRDKEIHTLYSMFQARKSLHKAAYQHRVVHALDRMIVEALCHANKYITIKGEDGRKLILSEVGGDMVAFTKLTDEILLKILYSDCGPEDEGLAKAQHIIKNIFERKLFRYIGYANLPKNISENDISKKLSEKFLSEDHQELVCTTKVKIDFGMGTNNPLKNVHVYQKHTPCEGKVISGEDDLCTLPKSFQELGVRFFCVDNDPDKVEIATSAVQKICRDMDLDLQGHPSEDSNNNKS